MSVIQRREAITRDDEREIITGMCVNTQFLKGLQRIYRPELLSLGYARVVAGWCNEYFEKYSEAPGRNIQSIFQIKKSELRNPDFAQAIDIFLESLSETFIAGDKSFDPRFAHDNAKRYFKIQKLLQTNDKVNSLIALGDIAGAEAVHANYERVEDPDGQGVSIFKDVEAAREAIRKTEEDVLFEFPGALGEIITPITRGDFFCFFGPGGRGKCVSGNTQILLSDGGVKSIESIIKDKDKSLVSLNEKNFKLTKSRVSEFYKNGVKPIFRIQTKSGRSIDTTENHPYFTLMGWKEVVDLSIGDRIATPRKIDFFGDKIISEDHVSIIAYLIADGGLTTGCTVFTKKDKFIKNDFIGAIKRLGDTYTRLNDLSINVNKGHKGPRVSETRKMLMSYGFKFGKSIYKKIPDVIFTLRKDLIALFLRKLFSCDGSIWKDTTNSVTIGYSSGSKELIDQVRHLLLRFGIISSTRSKIVIDHEYYELMIREKDYQIIFLDRIGFISTKQKKADRLREIIERKESGISNIDMFPYEIKSIVHEEIKKFKLKRGLVHRELLEYKPLKSFYKEKYKKRCLRRKSMEDINEVINSKVLQKYLDSDIMWDEIKSINYVGNEQTYDLTIPRHHNFIANDIVAHNSWLLSETAVLAVMSGINVLFISLEMMKEELQLRVYQRLCGEVGPQRQGEFDTIKIPAFDANFDNNGKVHFREVKKYGLTEDMVESKLKSMQSMMRGAELKLECFSEGSINVSKGIEPLLDNLEHYEGFRPGLILIDYPDILGFERNIEKRHQIDETWRAIRGLGQTRRIAIGVVSHTNKATYDRDIRQGDASETKTKMDHVTIGIALNQNEEDQDRQIMRFGILKHRFKKFSRTKEAVVVQCLDIGRPYIDSRLMRKE